MSAVPAPMDPVRRRVEVPVNLGFAVVAVVLAAVGGGDGTWPVATTVLLVVLFAAVVRLEIPVAQGYTSPVQLAFVPMLLLLPVAWVPLVVWGAWTLGQLPDVLARRLHPDRLLIVPGGCWFAVGPALVLLIADPGPPSWEHWPVYLLALAAQAVFDVGFGMLAEALAGGRAARPPLRVIALSPAIDALLAPLGLLAVLATRPGEAFTYAFLLLVPPIALLAFYARERTARLAAALALADAAGERERLIASASHELNTPLGVMTGLHEWLGPDRELPPARRADVHAAMGRELQQLRQRVRQFSDFTALRTERPLPLEIRAVEVAPVAQAVAATLAATADVRLGVPAGLAVHADPQRLEQLLLTLAGQVAQGTAPVTVTAAAAGAAAAITVAGPSPAAEARRALGSAGEDAGLELYVARRLAEAQDGALDVADAPGGGSALTLRLPLVHR